MNQSVLEPPVRSEYDRQRRRVRVYAWLCVILFAAVVACGVHKAIETYRAGGNIPHEGR